MYGSLGTLKISFELASPKVREIERTGLVFSTRGSYEISSFKSYEKTEPCNEVSLSLGCAKGRIRDESPKRFETGRRFFPRWSWISLLSSRVESHCAHFTDACCPSARIQHRPVFLRRLSRQTFAFLRLEQNWSFPYQGTGRSANEYDMILHGRNAEHWLGNSDSQISATPKMKNSNGGEL